MNDNQLIRHLYYFVKRIVNGLAKLYDELTKPTSYLKGDDFEECLRRKVFKPDQFDLVMKTHDFHENSKDYVESSLFPDYLFRDRSTGREFWVEAKYRENLYKGKIEWCANYQFSRYKKLAQDIDVVVAIGFGGRPLNPAKIFLIPLNEIKYTGLYPNTLDDFEFKGARKNLLDDVMDQVYDYQKEK